MVTVAVAGVLPVSTGGTAPAPPVDGGGVIGFEVAAVAIGSITCSLLPIGSEVPAPELPVSIGMIVVGSSLWLPSDLAASTAIEISRMPPTAPRPMISPLPPPFCGRPPPIGAAGTPYAGAGGGAP